MGVSGAPPPFVGHFVPWDGGCLFIGRGGALVPVHAHYAIQIAFGAVPGIRFRTGDAAAWTRHDAAIIPSRQPHAMDVTGLAENVVLFVEPETRQGRALAERWLGGGIADVPGEALGEARARLFDAWRVERCASAVERAAQDVVRALTGGVEPAVVSDPRLVRATAYVRANLHLPLSLDDVADVACLSPSRFRHLFVEQTGMALRPYILWRRFLHVWELLMGGASLSAAAHAAGFADAAHLSRTSRSVFGIPPSAMRMVGPLRPDAPGAPAPPVVAGAGAPDLARPTGQPLRSRG